PKPLKASTPSSIWPEKAWPGAGPRTSEPRSVAVASMEPASCLSPGPGPASIYYIFGATSERLMYINVVWSTSDEPTDDERSRIIVAGLQLANYFQRLNWRPEAAASNISLEPGSVAAVAGVDPDGAGVQVIMLSVPMTDEEGTPVELSGPSILQVSYAARFGEPDVVTIEPGAF